MFKLISNLRQNLVPVAAAIGLGLHASMLWAAQTDQQNPLPYNEKTAYLAYIKYSPSYDYAKHSKTLLDKFHHREYLRYRDNEFKLHSAEQNAVDDVKKRIAALPDPTIFKLRTRANFGKYNFDDKAFKFTPVSSRTYWGVVEGSKLGSAQTGMQVLSGNNAFDLTVSNPDFIQELPMAEKKAQKTLAQRTGGGYVDRSVILVLHIQMKQTKTADQSDLSTPTLIGKIIGASAYANNKARQPLATWP